MNAAEAQLEVASCSHILQLNPGEWGARKWRRAIVRKARLAGNCGTGFEAERTI